MFIGGTPLNMLAARKPRFSGGYVEIGTVEKRAFQAAMLKKPWLK
jgi:hypothetical protein